MNTDLSASNSSVIADSVTSSSDYIKSPSITSSDNDLSKEYCDNKTKISDSDFTKISNVNELNEPDVAIRNDLNNIYSREKQESIEALINKYATNKKYPSSSNINIYSDNAKDLSHKYRVGKETSKSIYEDGFLSRPFKNLQNECRVVKINFLTDRGLEYEGTEKSVEKEMREQSPILVGQHEEKKLNICQESESGQNSDITSKSSVDISNKNAEETEENLTESNSNAVEEHMVAESSAVEEKKTPVEETIVTSTSEGPIKTQFEEKETILLTNIEEELETVYEKGRVVEKEDTFEVLLNVKRFLHGRMSVRSKGHYTFLVEAEADNKEETGNKIALTKRFFIPGRVDMQKTSTSLSSDGILVITVPKLPPLKIHATSDIDRKERIIEEDLSKDDSRDRIKVDTQSKMADMRREYTDDKYQREIDRERDRKLFETEEGYDSDEDVATRISRKADKYACLSKEELGKEWGEIRSMEKRYKEWLNNRFKDEKFRNWCETKSKEEKHKDWFDTLPESKWSSYKDFFNARKNIEELFERKTKRRFEDDWFDRDLDWFDELASRDLGLDWFDSKSKSSDKFDSYRDRFGTRQKDVSSVFDKDDDEFFKSHISDGKEYVNKTKSETNRQSYSSEAGGARQPSYETSSKYYAKEESHTSTKATGARSKAEREKDDQFVTSSNVNKDYDFGSKTRSMMGEMRNEFRRDSESCFEFPIIKRGRFFQDSCFDDARDDFSSVLERFFDRKSVSERSDKFKEFKLFDDLKHGSGRRRTPNTVVTEDEACYKIEVPVGDVDESSLTVKEVAGNEIMVEGRLKSDGKIFKKQILFPLYGRADMQQATSSLLLSGLLVVTIPKTVPDNERGNLENNDNERFEGKYISHLDSETPELPHRARRKKNCYEKIFDEVEKSLDDFFPNRLKSRSENIFKNNTFHSLDGMMRHERFMDDKLDFRKRRRKKNFTKSEKCSKFEKSFYDDDFFNQSKFTKKKTEEVLPVHFADNFFSADFKTTRLERKMSNQFSINLDQIHESLINEPFDGRRRPRSPAEPKEANSSLPKDELKENELPKKFISDGELWYKVEIPANDLQENSLIVNEFGENEILVEAKTTNGDSFKEKIFFPANCDARKAQAVLSIHGILIVKVPTIQN